MSDKENFKACYDIKKRGVGVLNLKRALQYEPFKQDMHQLAKRIRTHYQQIKDIK